jgi:polyferredoxin
MVTRRIRLISQILFFVLFLILLVQTEYRMKETLDYPVRIFLEIDPLLTLAVAMAARGFLLFGIGLAAGLGLVIAGRRLAEASNKYPLFIAIPSALLVLLLSYPIVPGLPGAPFELWLILTLVFSFASVQAVLARIPNKELAEIAVRRYVPITFLIGLLIWGTAQYGIGRGLPLPMALGLVTVAVTLILGRVFCGWLCPTGSLHHLTAWLKRDKKPVLLEKNLYKPSQRWKYIILVAFLAAAVIGYQIFGLIDPISMLIRSFSVVVSPVINQAANAAKYVGKSTGISVVDGVSDWLYNLVAFPSVLSFNEPHYMGAILIGAVFIVVLALNLRRPRYWCRSLCPLGALLGTISRNSFYKLEINREACIHCGRCHHYCQGACDPEHREGWRPAECFVCFHCVDECPVDALAFRFGAVKKDVVGIDLKRRRALQAAAAGLVLVPVLRATEQYKRKEYPMGGSGEPIGFNPALIRPPGALPEEEFLQRCVRCGECMKVCPTNALHPATLEAGTEGMWTPVLVPDLGYCEYACTLCGQVCPTGAIKQLDVEAKKKVRIGTAFFDTTRCLPYAFGINCIVCQEHCPVSPKAIWLSEGPRLSRKDQEVAAKAADEAAAAGVWTDATTFTEQEEAAGEEMTFDIDEEIGKADEGPVKLPHVDLTGCTGCGFCEWVCVVVDTPAIRVTSVGESRNPKNRISV